METPEWLTRRGCKVAPGPTGKAWYVLMGNQPQYRLMAVPVKGRYGVAINQTNNGKRIPSESLADSESEAIRAGLEDLGAALGWR